MLIAAQKVGLTLRAIDLTGNRGTLLTQEEQAVRDKYMSNNIKALLDSNEHAKVVFWVGAGHLNDSPMTEDTPPEILGKDFKVFTVNGIVRRQQSVLNELSKGLSRAVLVDTSQAKNLGSIPQTFQDKYSKGFNVWDSVILFPDDSKSQ